MAAENLAISDYDAYADEYAVSVAWRERAEAGGDAYGILPDLLELLGDVGGCRVLDAGCGDGYLARVLAARGAQVTGIDLAPRLIEMARSKNPGGDIDYRVGDLSQPLPDDAGRFGVVTSYLVLNDVRDYRGFIATLATVLRPGGRLVLAIMIAEALALGLGAPVAVVAAATAVTGLAMGVYAVIFQAMMQTAVPGTVLARVSAFDLLGSEAGKPVGYALAGPIGVAVGRPARSPCVPWWRAWLAAAGLGRRGCAAGTPRTPGSWPR